MRKGKFNGKMRQSCIGFKQGDQETENSKLEIRNSKQIQMTERAKI